MLKLFFVLCLGGIAATASAMSNEGSICVAPVKDDKDPRGYYSDVFGVRVDKGEWVPVPSEKPYRIFGLSLNDKHLVSIRDGDETIESFWFRFDRYESNELCLWYKPWYRTWSLWEASHAGRKCRCDAASQD